MPYFYGKIVAHATILCREGIKLDSLMKYINRVYRCAGRYRSERLPKTELGAHQHIYIFQICRRPGISQEQLAKRICVNKSNVTRQLGLLEKQGYVLRRPDGEDRRVLRVYPTRRAEELYPNVLRIMQEWNALLFAELSDGEKEQFVHLLARVTDRAIEAVEGAPEAEPDRKENPALIKEKNAPGNVLESENGSEKENPAVEEGEEKE